jgi:hypothetical protein
MAAARRGVQGTHEPELNLIYWGTGNPHPVEAWIARPGSNLVTCSLVALDADTGGLWWTSAPGGVHSDHGSVGSRDDFLAPGRLLVRPLDARYSERLLPASPAQAIVALLSVVRLPWPA